jgi:hypothetical protein
MGVVSEAGATTVCFSRTLSEAAAKAVPKLNEDGARRAGAQTATTPPPCLLHAVCAARCAGLRAFGAPCVCPAARTAVGLPAGSPLPGQGICACSSAQHLAPSPYHSTPCGRREPRRQPHRISAAANAARFAAA